MKPKKPNKSTPKKSVAKQYTRSEYEYPPDGVKWDKESRRRKLLELAREIGLYNVSQGELASRMGVSTAMIRKDMDALVRGGIPKDTLLHAKFNIHHAILKVMREMQTVLLRAGKPSEKVAAATALLNAAEKHTDFLERYGEKERSAEVVDTSVVVTWAEPGKKKEGVKHEEVS